VVKDLFYLVPARKNFLKTTNTERGAILDRLQRFAMSHPECSFLFEHNGRRLLNFTRGDREADRIAAVLKLNAEDQLRQLPESGGDEIKLKGYVSLPTVQLSNSRQIYFFVNRRAVRDKALLTALLKAYEGTLPRGRYPAAVLFLTVADGAVDVNVHPAKEEVRFADGGRLFGLIRQAVAEALSGYPVADDANDFFNRFAGAKIKKDEGPLYDPVESSPAAGVIAENRGPGDGALPSAFYERAVDIESGNHAGSNLQNDAGLIRDERQAAGARWRPALAKNRAELNSFTTAETLPGMDIEAPGFFASMTLVGVLWNAYIVLQSDAECYMLDQHAAHERVLFEILKKNRAGAGPAQRLLLPVQIECSAAEENLAAVNCDRLKDLGFEFSSLGPGTLLLQTTPLLVDGLELEKVFLEALADLESGGRGDKLASIDALLAPLACRMAVKANRFLTPEEIRSLLKKLDRTPLAHTCPHGRPLYFKISKSEIEKQVQR
jgi:DNA mismatch repair protein MutL